MTRFWQDKRGSVAIIVAVSAMLLVVIAGAAVDFATAYYVRVSLQSTLDSASLAAGRLDINPTDSITRKQQQLTAEARNVFNANLDLSPGLVTVQPLQVNYTPPVGTTPDTVTVSVEASIPTNFLRIVGIPQFSLTVSSRSQRPQPGPIDLVLVLDTTTSMNDPPATGGDRKLTTLKQAVNLLVNQVMASGSANIQVGVVPYTSYVNIGLRNPVPDWVIPVDRDWCSSYSYQFPDAPCGPRQYYDCLIDGVLRRNYCYTQDCSARGRLTCNGTTRSPWGGCIGARTVLTVNPPNFQYNTWTDAFLDKISSPTNPKYSGQSLVSTANNALCPKPILGLTARKTDVLASIAGLVASGDTHIPNGLIWGWNLLAPGEPYAARTIEQLRAIGGRKVLLLMTDGINANSPRMIDGAYLPNGNTSLTLPWRDGSKTNTLTAQICNNIKAEGIDIFTVRFDVPEGTQIDNILKGCATDPTTMSFSAQRTEDLLNAFRKISDALNVLKLVQ